MRSARHSGTLGPNDQLVVLFLVTRLLHWYSTEAVYAVTAIRARRRYRHRSHSSWIAKSSFSSNIGRRRVAAEEVRVATRCADASGQLPFKRFGRTDRVRR